MPSDEGIRRVRRLIARVKADLGDLTAEEQVQIQEAVAVVRRSRRVMLSMPRIGQPLPDVRPGSTQNGSPISVSGIARQAGVDRTFLYRPRHLLALIHAAGLAPAAQDLQGSPPVSRASLQADLANAQAPNTRLVARVQQLE